MTSRPVRTAAGWARSVRGRLTLTYLAAAAVLAAVAAVLLASIVHGGLLANLDSGLRSRVNAVVADVPSSGDQVDPPPSIDPTARLAGTLDSFTALYTPAGVLFDAQPSVLPAAPLGPTGPARTASGFRTVRYAGQRFRELIQPVPTPAGTWLVVTGQSLSATDQASGQLRHVLYLALPVLVALIGAAAWLVSGAALRPVDRMAADADALVAGDTAGRIREPATADSLTHLARTLNRLLDRLHQALDQQRALVADAGHELRTPLAVLHTELQTAIRPNRTRADLADSITHAQTEVRRLTALADNLLLLAQADQGRPLVRPEPVELPALLTATVRAYRDAAADRQISLQLHCRADHARLDPAAARRILDNLLSNALRHTPTGGSITLTAVREPGPSAHLALTVTDTGPGFDPDFLPRAFDRFTRADPARDRASSDNGSGLGLAIVAALTHAHHGTATARNTERGGASVQICIPQPPASG